MAFRARLIPPQADRTQWPWHEVRSASLSVTSLSAGDRRFEAQSYLSSGFGLRLAIESKSAGWVPLEKMSLNTLPPRLKGIQVGENFGKPYLSATQVFDARPAARKFLSLGKIKQADLLSVKVGNILVTRSGTVGRVTLAHVLHTESIISDDLIRVSPREDKYYGWIYAYLRSPTARQMMTSAHYGHVIKHLEPAHLDALPVPEMSDDVYGEFNRLTKELLDKRNLSYERLLEAEHLFENAVGGVPTAKESSRVPFSVESSRLLSTGRRRLEASYHSPAVGAILKQFGKRRLSTERLGDLSSRVWWISRFKRIFGEGGAPYLSSDDMFTLNPELSKKVLVEQAEDSDRFFVKAGWIVMACSGQTYGLNGSVALATKRHEHCFFSHDIIRIAPRTEQIRAGYLLVALGHPRLGRPLVIRNAYGSSIPHLEPDDVADTPVVRLEQGVESQIADLMEDSVRLRDEGDFLENELTSRAEHLVTSFIAR